MEQKTQDCTSTNIQPQHATNTNTASEPTSPLSNTLLPTDPAPLHTPTVATSTPQIHIPTAATSTPQTHVFNLPWSKHNPLQCPNCDFLFNDDPATKETATSTLRTHFNSKHTGSQMNNSQLQIHINKTSSQNFHWCPSKKKFYSSTHLNKTCKVPHTTQPTHQCIRYTISQTRDNLAAHCRVQQWKWNDYGSGGANKCFLFCFSKILFGDHTRTNETKAILNQHALENVDYFKSYVPSLDSPPPANLAAAHLSPELQAYTDFIFRSLATGDRNEELTVGIARHLLQKNNITLVIHHALNVTGSLEKVNSKPDYSYNHTDHPAGNRVVHLGLYSQSHWIHFGTSNDPPPLFTATPNHCYSKTTPTVTLHSHTSSTPPDTLDYVTDSQPTPPTPPTSHQPSTPTTHQQSLHSKSQTLDYIKILPSIPIGAESALIRLAHSLLTPISTASATSNYSKASEATALFLKAFPAALSIMHGPGRSKTNRRRFKAKVWQRVNEIEAMDPGELHAEMQQLASSQQEKCKILAPTEGPSATLINSLLSAGFTSKAAKALSSNSSIAPPSDEVVATLIGLHPPQDESHGPFPTIPHDAPPTRLVAVASQLLKSARKLNTGRAPGPTGITMQHLVFLLSNETTAPLVANLICLINRGVLTGEGKTMLLASRLLAIKNGPKIRPVAVGETIYRLAAHYAISQIGNLSKLFPRIQLGLHRAGTERYIHRLQAFLEKQQNDCVVMSLDIKNAFNTRSRVKMAESLFKTRCTHPIWNLFHWAYCDPSHLNLYHQNGEYKGTILSQEGVRQGDILASFIFSLSMQPAYEKIDDILAGNQTGPTNNLDTPSNSQPPPPPPPIHDLSNTETPQTNTTLPTPKRHPSLSCAYIDDMSFSTTAENLINCFPHIAAILTDEGLSINWTKTSVFWASSNPAPETLKNFSQQPFSDDPSISIALKSKCTEILGTYIGHDLEAISDALEQKQHSLTTLFRKLTDSDFTISNQNALLLLRNCLVPQMNYLCRTLGPAAALLADQFSKHILNTAASIHGCDTATAPLWTLKIKDGGLGLQLPSLLLAPAYLSSLCLVAKDLNTLVDPSSLPKNTFPRTWAAFSETHALLHPFFREHFESRPLSPLKKLFGKTPEDTWTIYTSPDAPQKKLQKELTGPLYQALRKAYHSNLTPGAQQHNDAITYSKLGSRHLVTTPTNSLTTFSNIQWRTLFNFRFSIPIPGLKTRGLCMSCGTVTLTPLNTNTHALTCNSQKRLGSTVRHDLALLVIDDFLTSIGIPHTNEPQLFRHLDSNTKPDRVYYLPGQPKVVDMTIHSPTTHSQAGKLDNSSATLKAADAQKNNKYAALATKMGYSFIPLSATPYGAVGKPFEDFLALLANASEELGALNYEQALALLHNNLAMTIQKANVDIFLQAQAHSSSIHRPNQPRTDKDQTHHPQTESHDNPEQPTSQHPLLLSMLNFKLPHTLSARDATFQIPKNIILFARNLHLNRSIFTPQGETHTQVTQKFPFPKIAQAFTFLNTLNLHPQPLSLPGSPPPSSSTSLSHPTPSTPAPLANSTLSTAASPSPTAVSNPSVPLNPTPPNPESPISPPLSSLRNHLSHTIPANLATRTTPSHILSTSTPFAPPLVPEALDNPALPSKPFSPPHSLSLNPQSISPSTPPKNSELETTVELRGNAKTATAAASTTPSSISPTSSPSSLETPGDPVLPPNSPSHLNHSFPNLHAVSSTEQPAETSNPPLAPSSSDLQAPSSSGQPASSQTPYPPLAHTLTEHTPL